MENSHRLPPPSSSLLVAAGLGGLLAAGACTGNIGDKDATPGGGPGVGAGSVDPGPVTLRRLTNVEYSSTVGALLGVDPTGIVATFPADVVTSGFDNAALTQTISPAHAERYMAAAKGLAADVVGSPELLQKVLGCDPATGDRAACMKSFIAGFGRRAYRRPLTDGEVGRFLALTDPVAGAHDAAAMVLEAALQSPSFLFRVEIGVADPARPGLVRLTGYEVATRLSFFLWGSGPDDALLDAAAAGTLDTAEGVESAARAMLDDDRLQAAMQNFTFQWFHLDRVLDAKRDPSQYPEFTPELAGAMADELQRLLHDSMWGEGASFLDIYTTPKGYANDALAPIYGIDAPGSAEMTPVDWTGSADRGGLFTTAAFLTATTRGNATSPIQRGKYVREVALCDPLPPPPPGIKPVEQMPGQTAADAEEQHTKDPACAGCHVKINPIGYGLERYDALGRVRATYTSGAPVKQDGFIDGLEGSDFTGGVELGQVVKESAMGKRCVVAHVFRWALGRVEDDKGVDQVTFQGLGSEFEQAAFNFPELLVALATSDAFRYRRPKD